MSVNALEKAPVSEDFPEFRTQVSRDRLGGFLQFCQVKLPVEDDNDVLDIVACSEVSSPR
jgi:hypothetical protein